MIYLILCIVSSTLIFVSFKLIDILKIKIFPVIVLNYITASILGFLLYKGEITTELFQNASWLHLSLIIGILFIVMFYIIALTTQKAGITVTSVAAKMSVIIPILFSVLSYNEKLSTLNILGIILALISIYLTIFKKKSKKMEYKNFILPIIVFLGTGIIDSAVKYAQYNFISEDVSYLFSASVFTVAGIIGIVILFFKKSNVQNLFKIKTVAMGIVLGLVNFGSLYLLIMAFDSEVFNSSIIFGLNNIGVVSLSVIISLLLFKEKLNKLNILGILISLIAILLLIQST